MCRVLGVSRSGFYASRSRPPSRAKAENAKLTTEILEIHRASHGTYGSPRVHAELRHRGHSVNRKRIARLMAQEGLHGVFRRRFRCTTDSRHALPVHPNKLDRAFTLAEIDTAWASDITYVETGEGWLYLAVVMDLASRRVIGWSMGDHMRAELVVDALTMACGHRHPAPGALHHSDRGSQYASEAFQRVLRQRGLACSMSRRGNCYDNAVVESFFGTLKTELVHRQRWPTRRSARSAIHDYIEIFYNRRRRHSHLGATSARPSSRRD
ncbi:MAG: hypothetical protein RL562_658 [Planctomycetota bacterium]|jgi:putative transposase